MENNIALTLKPLIQETYRTGTIAAVAMIPFGLVFFIVGLRINEYGIRLVRLVFSELPNPVQYILFGIEHFFISWVVTLPIILSIRGVENKRMQIAIGVVYGIVFYIIVNSLILPILFHDKTPWELGILYVIPSLVVHIIYGFTVGYTFQAELGNKPKEQ